MKGRGLWSQALGKFDKIPTSKVFVLFVWSFDFKVIEILNFIAYFILLKYHSFNITLHINLQENLKVKDETSITFVMLTSQYKFSRSLQPHKLKHTKLPCPSPTHRDCSNSYPLNRWYHPNLIFCHPPSPLPPAFNQSQHQGIFQWISTLIQVPKILELQHQPFQWIFRNNFL